MHFVRRQTIVIHHFITPKQHRKNFICPRQRDGILSLKTFWIKVLLKWHYFVFPGKTCSCQCLTKVTWEPTEKPLGECLAGCDVGQTISVIDWGLFYIKNRRVLCDFILLIGISFYHYNIPKQRWHGRLCFLSSLFISRETPFRTKPKFNADHLLIQRAAVDLQFHIDQAVIPKCHFNKISWNKYLVSKNNTNASNEQHWITIYICINIVGNKICASY